MLVSTIICCNAYNIILHWFLKTCVSYQQFLFQQFSNYSAAELLGWSYYHLSPKSKSYFTLKCIKNFPQYYLNMVISFIFQLACSVFMAILIKAGSQRILSTWVPTAESLETIVHSSRISHFKVINESLISGLLRTTHRVTLLSQTSKVKLSKNSE